MICLYSQDSHYDLLIRVGHKFATLSKARAKAKKLKALQVEIRDEALPRSRSLVAVFVGGVEVGI